MQGDVNFDRYVRNYSKKMEKKDGESKKIRYKHINDNPNLDSDFDLHVEMNFL